jgi:hypothetical protein
VCASASRRRQSLGYSTHAAHADSRPRLDEANRRVLPRLSGESGIRTTSKTSAKSVDFGQGGAESGALVPEPAAIDPDLAAVVDAWATLPAAIKAGILAMIGAAG